MFFVVNAMEYPLNLSNMQVSRVFRDLSAACTSLDFTQDGRYLLSASEEEVLLVDADKGVKHKILKAQKYGVTQAHFLHAGSQSMICGSPGNSGDLRYWDLYENKYLRVLSGHNGPVTSISVHPYEDLILSGSADRSVLLWDLRKSSPTAKIPVLEAPHVAFDQQGLVFALSSGEKTVHLFDTRNFEKAEFAHFEAPLKSRIVDVKFSPCGKFLLLTSEAGEILIIDSFRGQLIVKYRSASDMAAKSGVIPSFSPDSRFVAAGHHEGKIEVWNTETGELVNELKGHTSVPRRVRFSPTRALMASACIHTALWINNNY